MMHVVDGRMVKEEGVKVRQRSVLRQLGMYETCVIMSCHYGRLRYAVWQAKMIDDKKW